MFYENEKILKESVTYHSTWFPCFTLLLKELFLKRESSDFMMLPKTLLYVLYDQKQYTHQTKTTQKPDRKRNF